MSLRIPAEAARAMVTQGAFDKPGDCPGCRNPLTRYTCWPHKPYGWEAYYCETEGCVHRIRGKQTDA